jgi:hypothetical protein
VPVRARVALPPDVALTVRVDVLAPVAAGANLMWIAQVAPAASTVVPATQSPAPGVLTVKSVPVAAIASALVAS